MDFTETPQPDSPADGVPPPDSQSSPPSPPDRYAHLPEDLRVPWDWRDIVVFFVFAVGSLIVVFTLFGPIVAELLQLPRVLTLRGVFYQMLWSGVVMLFLYAMIRIRFETPFWRTIGFRPLVSARLSTPGATVLYVFGGMMLAVVVAIAQLWHRPAGKLPIEQLFQSRQTVILLTFMGIAIAPLLEETIFRGFLYPSIARVVGVRGGVLIVGGLFGLIHAEQLSGGTWQVVLITVVGIVLTWVRARSGTVLASFLVHLGYNSILFAGFYASGGLKNVPGQ